MANRKIILIVDDATETLTLLRSMLNDYFDVRVAKSAKMALGLLGNLHVDLILLDIEMPGMSGFEFLRQLKERKSTNKDTPVIIITSHSNKKFIDEAIGAGAKGYLLKPIKSDTLYEKIGTVIGMPESATNTMEEKLKMLLSAVGSGDSSQAESLTRELLVMARPREEQIRSSMEEIAKLILAFDYEKGLVKIQEFIHNLSLNRMW